MTLTDSPSADTDSHAPEGASPSVEGTPSVVSAPAGGLLRSVLAGDHTVVGPMFIAVSLLFAAAAAVVGVISGWEAANATSINVFDGAGDWFRAWTLYRAGLVLLVVLPLLLGLAIAVIPAAVGAGGLAFPRATLGAFWSWLIGSIIVVVSVLAGGGWDTIDGASAREQEAIALTLAGTGLVIVSLMLAAISVATTVISGRRKGLSLLDVGPFAWSMVVAAAVWILSLPVLVANLVIVYADLRGRNPISFGTPGDGHIWAQLDWIVEQPAVYALAVPVLGIAAEMVESATNQKSRRPEVIAIAIGLFGLLAIGGWSQDYFTGIAESDHRTGLVYVAFGLVAVLPVLAVLGGVADSLRRNTGGLSGLLAPQTPAAVGALVVLLAAVAAGALRVVEPFDLLETSANSAVFNGVAVAALTAGIAGLWCWAPRVFCVNAPRAPGRAAALLLPLGAVLMVLAHTVAGIDGAGDAPALTASNPGNLVDAMNVVALVGSVLVAVGLLAVLAGAFVMIRGCVGVCVGAAAPATTAAAKSTEDG